MSTSTSQEIKKIAVLTSGGDAPGMNAAIRSVTRTAIANNVDVVGVHNGYEGLVKGDFISLAQGAVANCIQRGGTVLKTKRFVEFKEPSVRQQAKKVLTDNNIDALVVLGGDGSFRGAKLLSEECGVSTAGIPCTIDNDIPGTDYTIGFDTARNTAMQAIDKIRDTAFSHSQNFLVEVMGRASGFLAVDVGIAVGAEFILIPEIDYSVEQLVERIRHRPRLKMGSIIVVAEADDPGRSFSIAKKIQSELDLSYKVCVLGHIQRGGAPTARDRRIASLMGFYAVKNLLAGNSQFMVAQEKSEYSFIDFTSINGEFQSRRLSNTELIDINNVLCDI
jgi:6-phosphofructokinase 1